jgi:hypothetical protein
MGKLGFEPVLITTMPSCRIQSFRKPEWIHLTAHLRALSPNEDATAQRQGSSQSHTAFTEAAIATE